MGRSNKGAAKAAIDQAQAALAKAEDALDGQSTEQRTQETFAAIVGNGPPPAPTGATDPEGFNSSDGGASQDSETETIENTVACESGDPSCGPVERYDADGVPLCKACWDALAADSVSPFYEASPDAQASQPVAHPDARFATFTVADALTQLGVDAQFASSHPIHRTTIAVAYHPDGTATVGMHVEQRPERFDREQAACEALACALDLDAPRCDVGG